MSQPPREILAAIEREQPQGAVLLDSPAGPAATDQTLAAMRELAMAGGHSPAVIYLAREIVREVESHDYEGEVARIHRWVQTHVRYTQDPRGQEWVQTPSHTAWVQGQGDCDDHAVLVCALAIALGHGAATRPDDPVHVVGVHQLAPHTHFSAEHAPGRGGRRRSGSGGGGDGRCGR